jgi:hypothetical protein
MLVDNTSDLIVAVEYLECGSVGRGGNCSNRHRTKRFNMFWSSLAALAIKMQRLDIDRSVVKVHSEGCAERLLTEEQWKEGKAALLHKEKGEEDALSYIHPSLRFSFYITSKEIILELVCECYRKTNRHNEIAEIPSQLHAGSFLLDMFYYSRNFCV